jgi:hypothetical protein
MPYAIQTNKTDGAKMEICSLHALIACFSWSNLYLDTGLIYEDVDYVEINPATLEVASAPGNPIGRASLGYELRFQSLIIALEASHTSSLETSKDRGVNSISLRARWHPFRRN